MSKAMMSVLACCVAAPALAAAIGPGGAHAETLSEVVAYVYDHNPGLQSQRASLRALDESYDQARAAYGPNVSISAGVTAYQDFRQGDTFHATTDSESVALTQPIYTGGRVHARVLEAEAQVKAGRQVLRRFELDLLERTVEAYVGVRRDMELLKISQDTVAALEKELSNNQALQKSHELTLTDVSQAQARLAGARADLAAAMSTLATSRALFVSIVDRAPTDLEAPPPLDGLPGSLEQAFDAAERSNPQLLQAVYTEQGSRAGIAEARAGGRPSVNAELTLSRAPFVPYSSVPYDNVRSASVVLSQPIFTSGQIASTIRQAIQENDRDRLAIDDARLQVNQSVAASWEQLTATRKEIVQITEEMKADTFAFYGVGQEQKFALRTTIEVLNAELELSQAQLSLVRARAVEYVGRVQVLEATGQLDPQMLSQDVRAYDPTRHFDRVKNRGATPLEYPVRLIDALGSPQVPRQRPATLSGVHAQGSDLPPQPGPEAPIVSILAAQSDRPPPAPPN